MTHLETSFIFMVSGGGRHADTLKMWLIWQSMKIDFYHTFNPKLGILLLSTAEEIFMGKDLCQHVLSINPFHREEEWYLFMYLFTYPFLKDLWSMYHEQYGVSFFWDS